MIDQALIGMLARLDAAERQLERARTLEIPHAVKITAAGAFSASTASLTAVTLATISINPIVTRDVVMLFTYTGYNTNNNAIVSFGKKLDDDGAVTNIGQTQQEADGANYLSPIGGFARFPAVAAGSHILILTWNVNAGTAVYVAGSAIALEL